MTFVYTLPRSLPDMCFAALLWMLSGISRLLMTADIFFSLIF